ncbi:MAG: carbohydrate ABC transporter permease [Spirochaetaceae bacterium]|jgi:raffinose/stachyose/melibiose transport system permease protein|nr:carbohydrate ABC transporter permease [Spirochaetaceae bacterium]
MTKSLKNRGKPLSFYLGKFGSYFCMALAVFVALLPIVWVFLSSFKTNAEFFSGNFFPKKFSLDGYKAALRMAPIIKFFFNSVVVSVIAMLINVILVSMAAYIFARARFRFSGILYYILMLAMILPATAMIQPIYRQISFLGLLDTRRGLILVYSCLGMPMTLMIMRSFFSGIPLEMEESAAVDGAGFIRTYAQIILPLVKPGLTTCMVLRFLECWNEFTYALILTTSQAIRTLPLSLGYFVSTFSFNYMALFAAISIAALPSLLIFAVFSEQVVSSMTIGSVKG